MDIEGIVKKLSSAIHELDNGEVGDAYTGFNSAIWSVSLLVEKLLPKILTEEIAKEDFRKDKSPNA